MQTDIQKDSFYDIDRAKTNFKSLNFQYIAPSNKFQCNLKTKFNSKTLTIKITIENIHIFIFCLF